MANNSTHVVFERYEFTTPGGRRFIAGVYIDTRRLELAITNVARNADRKGVRSMVGIEVHQVFEPEAKP
jgi:hypothetical protein